MPMANIREVLVTVNKAVVLLSCLLCLFVLCCAMKRKNVVINHSHSCQETVSITGSILQSFISSNLRK